MSSLTLSFEDPASLRAAFELHLSKGRAFVPGAHDVSERTICEVIVTAPGGASHRLAAEVVYVRAEDPGRGVGLALAPLGAAETEALRLFVEAAVDEGGEDSTNGGVETHAARLAERMRALSAAEQQRLATTGTLPERMALERMYGPNVWEALLKSNRLSVPEVARIARKGTVPRPLIEMIAANATWLAAPEVQRALLSNPRASAAVVGKVLHAMPRGELTRVPQQTAYPTTVRHAAKKLLGQ